MSSVYPGKSCVDGCSGFDEPRARKRVREEMMMVCEHHSGTEDCSVTEPESTSCSINSSSENSENQEEDLETPSDAFQQLKERYSSLLGWEPEHNNKFTESLLLHVYEIFLERLHQPTSTISKSIESIKWHQIESVRDEDIVHYNSLPNFDVYSGQIHDFLNKLVVVKLNGGTLMGRNNVNSVLQVKNGFNFLDVVFQQIILLNKQFNVSIPVVLMNSFYTDKDTQKVIRKFKELGVDIHTFNQAIFPYISEETLEPIAKSVSTEENLENCYPPGHGDFYECFHASGLLKKFIDNGREYCFISNINNLGATVDLNILNHLMSSLPEFVMEVISKTQVDVNMGALVRHENKLQLLEISQVPEKHHQEFKSSIKFRLCNTNNLWIKLDAIDRVLSDGSLNLEMIANHNTENDLKIIKFERPIGSGIKSFSRSFGLNVLRSRYVPVKKTSDLLLVMSDLYLLQNGTLSVNPSRMFPTTPLVKLDDTHFSKVKDLLSRFETIPSIYELDHLTVAGDVKFGRNVSLKGTIIIIAKYGERIDIPSDTTLENKIVTGNLRILDH